ncbi:MAG TPA: D-alanyl-D-alanine carboxypeptidase family protein [Thiobacillaceae bacterium]|nr:D-alanyl-D-alanine carboxypeptidase family protein [Thiobacillaceae bacterium]
MRMLLSILLSFLVLTPAWAQAPAPPAIQGRAWLLVDTQSGRALTENNADMRVEPASLTKLMTAYLVFSALRDGQLRLDQALSVSERAWRAEGSRMFLDPKRKATVDEMLHGMIIQSGNDASIALAEAVAGSEPDFAIRMNQQAARLGMKSSHFVNATGLPHPEHYSTARDLYRLAASLIREFPQFYKYYAIKEYRYNGITQPNRNRLLWTDPHVDGVKTGHTESAGYCLIASATRDQRRLLSVVLGAQSDAGRALESQKLLNYGFQHFETVRLFAANQTVSQMRIYRGTESQLKAGFLSDLAITVPRGQAERVKAEIVTKQPMLAPVSRGQQIGSLRLTLDGKPFADYPLRALHAVPTAGLLGRMWDGLLLMFE